MAQSSDTLIPAAHPERRPAIWPWLVMPLVALTIDYALHRLQQHQKAGSFSDRPQAAAIAPAETDTP
jgi:hypothetical protein